MADETVHEHDGYCLKAGGICSPEAQGWADIGPSPAELGDTMTVDPGVWTPLDDHGTQIYVYGDQPVDVAVQTADVDDEIRQLRAGFHQIDRLLDQYRGEKALRAGVRTAVDRALGVTRPDEDGATC